MAVNKLNPSAGGIPYGNTAGRPANPGIGRLYSNGELQRLELYTGATYGWQNIVAETPGVTGYTGTVIETNSTNTITITGTNFAAGATATLVGTDGTEIVATSTTVTNLTQIVATFGPVSGSIDPYDIRVTNPSNLYGVYYDILNVNDKPVWTTAAGSLGTFNQGSTSYQLVASDEENNLLTYSLVSGSLPTGLTLSSSGLISGTNAGTANTTYNFTISVSDSSNTAQSRTFSVYVPYPTVTGGTLTSDATYYYRTFTATGNLVVSGSAISGDVLIVGGGGGAAGNRNDCGGGGGGGFRSLSGQTFAVQSHNVIIGSGGSGSNGSASTSGINSSIGNLSATGGGTGSASGGSGGGGNRDGATNGGSGNAGGYTPVEGYAGGTTPAGGYRGAAGGGGAGAIGSGGGGGTATSEFGGAGGIGSYTALTNAIGAATSYGVLSGGNYYYAGGGGGGTESGARSGRAAGGIGGGGLGCEGNLNPATAGAANTGGGGGGAGIGSGSGANGGSGIVVFRYTKASVGG